MVKVNFELDPPALHRASPLQSQITEAKASLDRVRWTKTANDEAMIEAGRVLLQLREQTPVGWGQFCQKELGTSKQWANKLIGFAKGTETPAENREKKAAQAQARAETVSVEAATVHAVKTEEVVRITRIRELCKEWRRETRAPDDILADIEELVK